MGKKYHFCLRTRAYRVLGLVAEGSDSRASAIAPRWSAPPFPLDLGNASERDRRVIPIWRCAAVFPINERYERGTA